MNDSIDYQADAKERLAKCGGTLKLKLSDTKTAPFADDGDYRPHYRCTLSGPGGTYTFNFWNSIHAGATGEEATVYDVLSCLDWNCPENFEDFCSEFGYDTDSMKAHRIWKGCLAQTRALNRIFPAETARECLAEIR